LLATERCHVALCGGEPWVGGEGRGIIRPEDERCMIERVQQKIQEAMVLPNEHRQP